MQFHKVSRFFLEYSNPILHKCTHFLPRWCLEVILFPADIFHSVDVYINNRFVSKIHCLTSKHLEKGQWYEFETRLLYCNFSAFEWFVENDMCHVEGQTPEEHWKRWDTEAYKEHYSEGMRERAEALDTEIKALYYWWKERQLGDTNNIEYVSRKAREYFSADQLEIYDSIDTMAMLGNNITQEQEAICDAFHERVDNLEANQSFEDTEMLCRLMKLRCSLWS